MHGSGKWFSDRETNFLYDGSVRFLSLVLQQDIAKLQQHDLHGAGIDKNDDLFSSLSISRKSVDFGLHLGIFPVRLLVRVTEYQNNLIPFIQTFVLEPGRNLIGRVVNSSVSRERFEAEFLKKENCIS